MVVRRSIMETEFNDQPAIEAEESSHHPEVELEEALTEYDLPKTMSY